MKTEIIGKLRKEHLKFISFALDQKAEATAISDMEGNLLFVNEAFASLHGFSPDELVGSHLSIFHNQEQTPDVVAAIWQLHEKGEFSGKLWHVRRDGAAFPCMTRCSIAHDENGKPIGMITMIQAISQSRRARPLKRYNAGLGIAHSGARYARRNRIDSRQA